MTDAEILELFFARDEAALRETDAAYGSRLRGLAHRILANREDAEETVSDTYWKAWNAIPPECPAWFFAYLAKICRRAALNRLEKQCAAKRNAEVVSLSAEMEECIPSPDARADAGEIREALNRFLAGLPPQNRMLFLRRYWYADSLEDAARFCGIAPGTAATQLHRLRKKLREKLIQEGIWL